MDQYIKTLKRRPDRRDHTYNYSMSTNCVLLCPTFCTTLELLNKDASCTSWHIEEEEKK